MFRVPKTKKVIYRDGFEGNTGLYRLCRSIGDVNHRKTLFNKLNEELLSIVEQLCGHPLLPDPSLLHLLCRPCERRLKNIKEFREVVRKTQNEFRQQQPCDTRVKRCLELSPSASQPPRSRMNTSGRSARTSLNLRSKIHRLIKRY